MAWSDGMENVRVVRSATPSVAVRPGSIPTMMPRSVAHRTLKRDTGVRKPRMPSKK